MRARILDDHYARASETLTSVAMQRDGATWTIDIDHTCRLVGGQRTRIVEHDHWRGGVGRRVVGVCTVTEITGALLTECVGCDWFIWESPDVPVRRSPWWVPDLLSVEQRHVPRGTS